MISILWIIFMFFGLPSFSITIIISNSIFLTLFRNQTAFFFLISIYIYYTKVKFDIFRRFLFLTWKA